MNDVKALLTLRYRRVSDTITGFVTGLVDDQRRPDLAESTSSEKLDADTTVEWGSVDGLDLLVGVHQMHASVNTRVLGLPAVVSFFADQLIESQKAEPDAGSPADLIRVVESRHEIPIEQLERPHTSLTAERAPRFSSKAVEAALFDLIDRIDQQHILEDDEAPVKWALRDLALSIADGEGLSSARSADAAVKSISSVGMRSRTQRQRLLSIVNDTRSQRTWSRAIETANRSFTPESANVDVDD